MNLLNYDDFIPRSLTWDAIALLIFGCRYPVKNQNWCRVRSEDKRRTSNGKLNVLLVYDFFE